MDNVKDQRITPFLWFETQAEEAVHFYTSVVKNSTIERVTRWGAAGPGPEGSVMTIAFSLAGVDFIAFNGGPVPGFTFSPATSFVITCESQDEVDELWTKLAEDGTTRQCGWLTDKFGVTWQVVPAGLAGVLAGEDEAGSQRAMRAMLEMEKLDIDALRRAYAG